MSFDIPEYNPLHSLLNWVVICGGLIVVVLLLSMFTAALGGAQLTVLRSLWASVTRSKKPESQRSAWSAVKQAFANIFRSLGTTIKELCTSSPRRVWALAMLTFKESTRRKALLVFVIFALLFMFGGWFLADANPRPELQVKVHVAFVLTAISWLILPVALLLSCWGLPEDIKQRSLHTVVTKPVRRSEIILGRMLGYSLIGTLVLLVMGVAGYIWIDRQVPSAAKSQLTCRVPVYGKLGFLDRQGNPGRGVNVGDTWMFRDYVEGASRARAIWEFQDVTPDLMVALPGGTDEEPVKRLQLETRFEAFRTHKGNIRTQVRCELFFARNTREQAANALASCPGLGRLGPMIASGDFPGAATILDEAKPTERQLGQFSDGCGEFATVVRPYLTGKSAEESGKQIVTAAEECANAASVDALAASLSKLSELFKQHGEELQRHLVDRRVSLPAFEVKEFELNVLRVDPDDPHFTQTLVDKETGEEVRKHLNLFEDIVEDGKLRVEVSCVDGGQYIGAARPDLFIRTPDKPFWVGFSKSIFGIWMMMELVVVLGVTAGSLLNGPVSTFLVFALMIVGQGFRDFLQKIVEGRQPGGGVFESVIRIARHLNPITQLEEGASTTIVKAIDAGIDNLLWLAYQLIPDFRSYGRVLEFAPNGFDVSWWNVLMPCLVVTVGYLIPCVLVGYYCLKLRELEQK